MDNIKAVIFDMDGLLFDTERISLETFVEACRENHFEPDLKVYYKCIGTNWTRAQEILQSGYGPDFPFKVIYKIWLEKYHRESLINPLPLKPGALGLLQHLEREQVRRAVVTSSRHQNAMIKLSNAGIIDFFEFVLGGDEISVGKPNPEMYLTACRKLSEKPGNCLALEDSDNGVLSATRAGLRVIQVPDLLEPSPEVKALKHPIVKSLVEVEKIVSQSTNDPR